MKQTVLNIIILTVSITNLSVSALSPLRKVNNAKVEGRRQFLSSAVAVGGLFTCLPSAFAKAPPSGLEGDKAKIVAGYKRLNYLLDNWEKETTQCKTGNDNPYLGCDRTPEKVMEYLGFKSMEDPLFRADKTLIRLQSLVPAKDADVYQDAVDTWLEKAEEGNGLAFISSWGEANPGGGKDRVALFIERSRKDVVESRDVLKTVIQVLDLKVD
mmetsp:Transcript_7993/g.10213  ORF Transcript_7993/g.10213 Transcript_7993/m.10213 type:complete len:213 (-) Transcript_7993:119-757(-)|eukprot:CAMPEP_0116062148 /NCGR_PEP_ID=MMETSP0322-20121206/7559_1 /TAXON_ID=163516 /ORGANISM="Leptocylindrus danicus var. apora, Strain B651" /LENGTH=212 /DNA_ID=CAMNT_0003547345 /DNA_START=165 /DNA_END=803 /DNA_ORIENTATION=+